MTAWANVITTGFIQTWVDAIDTTLATGALTQPCTLYYANNYSTECPNCLWSSFDNRSAGIYQSGGPQSFTGICPVCHGVGRVNEDTSETLYLMTIVDSKSFRKKYPIDVVHKMAETLCSKDFYDKIRQANEVVLDTTMSPSDQNRYKRYGDPSEISFGTTAYILTSWEKIT